MEELRLAIPAPRRCWGRAGRGYGCGFGAYRYRSVSRSAQILTCCRANAARHFLFGVYLTDSISIEPSLAVISSYFVTVLGVRIFMDPV